MNINLIFVCLLLISPLCSFTQDKVEFEEKIKTKFVPKKAISMTEKMLKNYKYKNKWFLENNEKGEFYELKTKIKGDLNSIKFDSLGHLIDIEIITPKNEMNKSTLTKIENKFNEDFNNYKIFKVQTQFTGTEEELAKFYSYGYLGFKIEELPKELDQLDIFFEIEVKGKKEIIQEYEYLFDREGVFIFKRKIISNAVDHLNY